MTPTTASARLFYNFPRISARLTQITLATIHASDFGRAAPTLYIVMPLSPITSLDIMSARSQKRLLHKQILTPRVPVTCIFTFHNASHLLRLTTTST